MLERLISRAGWTRVAFGDVVRKVNDKVDPWDSGLERYVAGEHMATDNLRIRRWGLIGDDYLGPAFHMRFKPGHVLYGSRRTYLRKVALADFEGITANTTFVLETRDAGKLMPELLPFLMQTEAFHSHSIKHSKGSVNPYINFSDLEAFEFLLPPIQEQARLVETIGAASAAREQLLDLRASAGVLRDSLSESLFAGVLGGTAKEGNPIGDFFDQVIDRGHTDLPILSVTIDGTVVRRSQLERHVSDDTGEQKYLRVQRGDLAYNTMRLWQGAVGIVEEEGLISPAYTVVRPKIDGLDIEFFWYLLRSRTMQREYRRLVTGVASDRWRLYFKDLLKVRAKLPESEAVSNLWETLKSLSDQCASIERRIQGATAILRMLQKDCFS